MVSDSRDMSISRWLFGKTKNRGAISRVLYWISTGDAPLSDMVGSVLPGLWTL
jgi:hypothetical protein